MMRSGGRFALAWIAFPATLGAATITVSPSDGPFQEIASALSAAEDGDTVLVEPGEYIVREPIDFAGKRVVLRSSDGAAATSIRFDGDGQGFGGESIFIFQSGEGPETVVEGFTLRGGKGTGACIPCVRRGGAIHCEGSSPTLRRLRILECSAAAGGAVYIGEGASPRLEDCLLARNEATAGGALYLREGSSPVLVRCVLRGNRAGNGGGIFAGGGSTLRLEDSRLASNTAVEAGGAALEGAQAHFQRTTIAGNRAEVGGAATIQLGSTALFEEATILGNEADEIGGGFFASGAEVVFRDVVLAQNGAPMGGAFHAERTRLDFEHATIARNRSTYGNNLRLFSIEKALGAWRLRSSIVWENFGDQSLGDQLETSFSCLESGPEAPGVIHVDPLFCGWEISDAHVDARAEEIDALRDGSSEAPFADLAEVFERHSFATGEDSPCRGTGEEGSDMGASARGAGCGGQQLRIVRLAPGSYPVGAFTFQYVEIEGAGWEETTLLGTLRVLSGNFRLEGVTVTEGSEGGVSILGGLPQTCEIIQCRIIGNRGPGISTERTFIRAAECLIAENTGEGFLACSNTAVELSRSTIARNGGPGTVVCCGSRFTVDHSILWGNASLVFGGCDPHNNVARSSVIEGGWGGANITSDAPGFCGFDGESEFDVSSQYQLERHLEPADFSYALSADSPLLERGIGAPTGICDRAGAPRRIIRLGPGSYGLRGTLLDIDLIGAGAGQTSIEGVLQLGAHTHLEGLTLKDRPSIQGQEVTLRRVSLLAGVSVDYGAGARIEDSLVQGGGVENLSTLNVDRATLDLERCTITEGREWGIRLGQGARVTVASSIVWRNQRGSLQVEPLGPGEGTATVHHSCIEGGWPGTGNIAADPRFCGLPWVEANVRNTGELLEALLANVDYRLQADSPCLGAGAEGATMGADLGTCPSAAPRVILLADGHYSLGAVDRVLPGVTLRGASRDGVVLQDIPFPLRDGFALESLTVSGSPIHIDAGARPLVRNVRVERSGGPGITCGNGSAPTIEDVLVASSTNAGILCRRGSAPRIERCTITGNEGPGIEAEDGAHPVLESSIVWGNRGGAVVARGSSMVEASFSNLDSATLWPGEGNRREDPLFCRWDTGEVWVQKLKDIASISARFDLGLSLASPCRGSGLGGEDMGASLPGCETSGPSRLFLRLPPGTFADEGNIHLPRFSELRGSGPDRSFVRGVVQLQDATGLSSLTAVQVVVESGAPVIHDCVIRSGFRDAGVICLGGSAPSILHCTIVENMVGVRCHPGAVAHIQSSIIWSNPTGSIVSDPSSPAAVSFSCVEARILPAGSGNSIRDPLFCGWPGPLVHVDAQGPENGDGEAERPFRELGPALEGWRFNLSTSSPCIGAAGDGRDMGASLEHCGGPPVAAREILIAPGSYQEGFLRPGLAVRGSGAGAVRLDRVVTIGNSTVEDLELGSFEALGGSPQVRRCSVTGTLTALAAALLVEDSSLRSVVLSDRSGRPLPTSEAVLRRCRVQGGGIQISGLRVRVEDTLIEGAPGFGIRIDGCGSQDNCVSKLNPTLVGCRIVRSRGGIEVLRSSPLIERCFIAGNLETAIRLYEASPQVLRCTIVGNASESGVGGIDRRVGAPSAPRIDRSIIWGNAGVQVDRSDHLIGSLPTVTSSIIQGEGPDPLFVGWGGRGRVHVGTPTRGDGDGTPENPFVSIDLALSRVRYSYAVAPGSPVLTFGPGGTEVGSGAEVDDGPRSAGLEVVVAPGVYPFGFLNVAGQVSITGSGQESTILQGGSIIGLRTGSRLAGLTITAGRAVVVGANDAPVIEACTFRECGDAIFCPLYAGPRIVWCKLYHNGRAVFAGENYAEDFPGAPAPQLSNCEVVENGLGIGLGQVRPGRSLASLEHCTVAGNNINISAHQVEVMRSIVWGGWTEPYGVAPRIVQSLVGGNPRFRGLPSIDDRGTPDPADDVRIQGDYRLLPTSPAIDSILDSPVTTDLEGNARPCHLHFDAGAHEYCEPFPVVPFLRGEVTGDREIDLSDAIRILDVLFTGGPPLPCVSAADANDDGGVDISDPLRLLGWLFLGQAGPPEPTAACGLDPTPDRLVCEVPPDCR